MLVLVDPWKWRGQPIHVGSAMAIIIACISWAIGSLYSRTATLPKAAFLATGMEMMAGGICLMIVGSLRNEWQGVHLDEVSRQSLLAFAYLIVFGSLIGFSAYIWLLQNVSAAAVSTYAYVNPIVAVALGWMFLREPIGWNTLIAGALILSAVVLITARRRKAIEPAEERLPAAPKEKRGVVHAASESCIEHV